MTMTSANLMWRTREILHGKNSPIVPGILMVVASSLVVYRHMTQETKGEDHLKTFLALIVVQMLPLVALEMKIMSCADPVGLFCKFATPVTLLHGMFLLMRVCQYPLYAQGYVAFSVLGFVGAAVTISIGFRKHWSCIFQYQTIWTLLLVAIVAACCTESLEVYFGPRWMRSRSWQKFFGIVMTTANSYVELMAFVPAVWMVFRDTGYQGTDVPVSATKRTSTAFFLFLVIFYFTEDLFQAYEALFVAPMAAAAHVVHFLLLLDFALYVLAHVYNPEKLMGELRRCLSDFSCGV